MDQDPWQRKIYGPRLPPLWQATPEPDPLMDLARRIRAADTEEEAAQLLGEFERECRDLHTDCFD